jgi:serine/threonine protein kinase
MTSGSRLGPYEIVSPLGAGGMGEVYRARDTRLERTVAIKVLPSHLSSNAEFHQRLEREAKTISQLSHPHICVLYDVGQEGETEYLVMEYLEGETLADRLAKGPLALEQTSRYGVEIADAIDKAHRSTSFPERRFPLRIRARFSKADSCRPAGVTRPMTSRPTGAS